MENTTQPQHLLKAAYLRLFLWILLFLAGAEFVVRGPVRYLREATDWNDFSQSYTASKLWMKGQSPSDPQNFITLWKQEGKSRLLFSDIRTHLAPMPGSLILLAPIAAFHWGTARVLWMPVLLVAFAMTLLALTLASDLRWNDPRTLIFAAACLAFAPFHTGLASGNATILVIGMCATAVWAARTHRDLTAGALFGIACSMKPHIGAFLVLYYLVRLRWRLFLTAIATTFGLGLLAASYLQLRGASLVHDYLRNAREFITANPIDDFSSANPIRFTMINLQVPFFSITGSSSLANSLALLIAGIFVVSWIYFVVRERGRTPELLALAAIAVIGLLPVYHRFYDASLLVFPLCWCMTRVGCKPKAVVWPAIFLMGIFLIPGSTLLQRLTMAGYIPAGISTSWWWNCLVMPHETWTLLLLALVLLRGIVHGAGSPQEGQNGMMIL